MRPEVIGMTTNVEDIAEKLGVQSDREYGLYHETQMGRYYAKFLPDGTFENKVVRLVTTEQAAEQEATACATIKNAGENIQKAIASVPVIDMDKFNENVEAIQSKTKESAEQMGKTLKNILEQAVFHSTYRNKT